MIKFLCLVSVLSLAVSCKAGNRTDTPVPGNEGININVMTYNITQSSFNNTPGDANNWEEVRKHRVVKVIRDNAPDILCLQEDEPEQGEFVCTELGLVKRGVSKRTGTVDGTGEFNAIYYDPERFVVEETGHFFFSDTPDTPSKSWDAGYVTHCNWFRVREASEGMVFYVFNMHLVYTGEVAREMSGIMLGQRIPRISGKCPVIAVGDFNDSADSKVYASMVSFMSDSRTRAKSVSGPYGTFNSFNPGYNFEKYRLDYMFVSGDVGVYTYRVVTDKVDGHFPSDHFPVQIYVNIKN